MLQCLSQDHRKYVWGHEGPGSKFWLYHVPPRLVDRTPGGTHHLLGILMLKQSSSSNLCRKWDTEGVSKRPSEGHRQ